MFKGVVIIIMSPSRLGQESFGGGRLEGYILQEKLNVSVCLKDRPQISSSLTY